jgi:hypothetical protein
MPCRGLKLSDLKRSRITIYLIALNAINTLARAIFTIKNGGAGGI